MARKLTAVFEGQTFSRRTDRTYTHVVIAKGNKANDLAHAKQRAEWDVKNNWAYYVREADEATRNYSHTDDEIARFKHIVELGKAGYLAERIAASVERIEKADYTSYTAVAWCGRLDLANKQADAAQKRGLLNVWIIEVQQ